MGRWHTNQNECIPIKIHLTKLFSINLKYYKFFYIKSCTLYLVKCQNVIISKIIFKILLNKICDIISSVKFELK